MTSWTNATPGRSWRAVVRPQRILAGVERVVLPPTPTIAPWVEQVWSLAWHEPIPASTSALIPHPTVHLTLEGGPDGEIRHGHRLPAALVHGTPTTGWRVDLPAEGWVVGLHLRPGAYRGLTGQPAHLLTDQVVAWADAWPGWNWEPVWAAPDPTARAEALTEAAAAMLAGRETSPETRTAQQLERQIREDGAITCVDDLVEACGIGARTVQRLCREHLGLTARALITRARVMDAHELLLAGETPIAEVATRTGFYDQAHLTRVYAAITGVPPGRLQREGREPG